MRNISSALTSENSLWDKVNIPFIFIETINWLTYLNLEFLANLVT